MPLISIVVPVFNAQNTLQLTINSISNQTCENFECILVNDASNDDSKQIIEKITHNDERFHLINNEKNIGVTSSRNRGISKATGKFICFLDSDDVWRPDFLDSHLKFRDKNPNLAITYSPYYVFYKKKSNIYGYKVKPPNTVDSNNILYRNHIPLLTVMLDIEIIGKITFSQLRPEDYYLWVELIYKRGFIAKSLNSFTAYYRISSTQRSRNKFLAIQRLYRLYMKNTNNIFVSFFCILRWGLMNLRQRNKKTKILNKKEHKYIHS